MKVSELIRRTNTLIDDTIDNINLIDWFNSCQNDLSRIVYIPKITTITRDSNNEFVLPTDYKDSLVITTPNISYRLLGNKILGVDSSVTSLDIEYNRKQATITNSPDFVPDLPEQFHDCFVYFAGKMALILDEEEERLLIFDREYMKSKIEIKRYMDSIRPVPTSWGVVR